MFTLDYQIEGVLAMTSSLSTLILATVFVATASVATAQGTGEPLPDGAGVPLPTDAGAFPFPTEGLETFDPSNPFPDPGFEDPQTTGEPTATQMRQRAERATVIPSQEPNASSMFGGQLSSQNASVEQGRRSRLVDELTLILRSLRSVSRFPDAETGGESVSSGDVPRFPPAGPGVETR
jgi:hypothetical protein